MNKLVFFSFYKKSTFAFFIVEWRVFRHRLFLGVNEPMQKFMPDIAHSAEALQEGTLDWVGMSQIELPLVVSSKDNPEQHVSALAEAFVNLNDPQAKGIHMSRLYLALDEFSNHQTLTPKTLATVLDQFISSHHSLSDQAQVTLKFDYHLRRRSLLSGKTGWKAYPVEITATYKEQVVTLELSVSVTYSSTCPCSAALARQLIQQAFDQQFTEQAIDKEQVMQWLGSTQGIVATPHSQRSIAQVKVKLNQIDSHFDILGLIDVLENELKTPVQAAVKREDEQEFARLNGQNLMFCEDAARKVKHILNQQSGYADFWLRINHYESLHAHDAVSVAVKGVELGYTA